MSVRFSSLNASIMLAMIAGARPLLGSSTSSSWRGSTMARAIASICFCPPESLPAEECQNFFSAGKRREDPLEPLRVERARVARGEHHVLVHRQAGEDAHVLRHVGDAELAMLGGRERA